MPHHWGVVRVFESLASFHFMKLLDLAARYFHAFSAVGRRRKKDADALDGWQDAMYLAVATEQRLHLLEDFRRDNGWVFAHVDLALVADLAQVGNPRE
jgi:hypothetical protein